MLRLCILWSVSPPFCELASSFSLMNDSVWVSTGKFQFALIVKDCWVIVASQHSNSSQIFKVLCLQSVLWGENLAPLNPLHICIIDNQDLDLSISTITVFWYRVSFKRPKNWQVAAFWMFYCVSIPPPQPPAALVCCIYESWDGMVYVP